jgi:hypothetical protein
MRHAALDDELGIEGDQSSAATAERRGELLRGVNYYCRAADLIVAAQRRDRGGTRGAWGTPGRVPLA